MRVDWFYIYLKKFNNLAGCARHGYLRIMMTSDHNVCLDCERCMCLRVCKVCIVLESEPPRPDNTTFLRKHSDYNRHFQGFHSVTNFIQWSLHAQGSRGNGTLSLNIALVFPAWFITFQKYKETKFYVLNLFIFGVYLFQYICIFFFPKR